MGFKTDTKVIFVIFCLILAAYLVHFRSSGAALTPKASLRQTFSDISDWKGSSDTDLDPTIIDSLDLDDYLFRSYHKANCTILLYVGYYRTTRKIGAAHSPLVCFPGQGWEISMPVKISLPSDAGSIQAEKLVVHKGLQQELLIYWFQSYDKTSSGTFWQKIYNFRSRVQSLPEDNAFVRISLPINGNDAETAYQKAVQFISIFYPKFHSYITGNSESL